MEPEEDKFEDLLDDSDRSRKLKKNMLLLVSTGGVIVLFGLLLGALPGIGFAVVYAYAANKILERPRQREKLGKRSRQA